MDTHTRHAVILVPDIIRSKKQVLQHRWFLAFWLSVKGLMLISGKHSLSPSCPGFRGNYMQGLAAAVESVTFAVGSTTAPSGVGRFQKWKRKALGQCSDLTLTGKHSSLLQNKNSCVRNPTQHYMLDTQQKSKDGKWWPCGRLALALWFL